MQLVITEPAEADLKNIFSYIAAQNIRAAEGVYREILFAAKRLLEFPNIGKSGRVTNTFEFLLADLPYMLVYRETKEEIILIAVFHSKMDLRKHIQNRNNS
jgi:plasmid stabilization system protein ParE